VIFRLRFCIRAIKKKSDDLFEHFFANVHRTVNSITRLDPIHFASRDIPLNRFTAVAKLDFQKIAAQDNRHPMKGVAMPGRGLTRREPLPADEIVATMMQDLLVQTGVPVRLFAQGALDS